MPKKHADKIQIIHEGSVCKYGSSASNINDVLLLYTPSNKYMPNVHELAAARIFAGIFFNLWFLYHIFAAKYTVAAGININVLKKYWHDVSLHSFIELQR